MDFLSGKCGQFGADYPVHTSLVSSDQPFSYRLKLTPRSSQVRLPEFPAGPCKWIYQGEGKALLKQGIRTQESQGVDQATVVRLTGFQELNVSLLSVPWGVGY